MLRHRATWEPVMFAELRCTRKVVRSTYSYLMQLRVPIAYPLFQFTVVRPRVRALGFCQYRRLWRIDTQPIHQYIKSYITGHPGTWFTGCIHAARPSGLKDKMVCWHIKDLMTDQNNHINRSTDLSEQLVLLCSIITQQYTLQCTIHRDSCATLPLPSDQHHNLRCDQKDVRRDCLVKLWIKTTEQWTLQRWWEKTIDKL